MGTDGLNFSYSGLYLPYSIWQVYYPFSGQTGGFIPSISGANTLCSGQILLGNPTANGGTGFFNKNTLIQVSNSTGSLEDWTLICQFSKLDREDGIIFSSLKSGIANSGFVFGVSAGNRLYVESYDESGPISFTSSIILGARNVVGISKIGQAIYFDYFNANNKEVESQKFEFYSQGFLPSNHWYVGGFTGAYEGFVGKYFSGHINDLALFNEPLRPEEIKTLFRGLVSDIAGGVSSYNTGALDALGMNAICYLNPLDLEDTTETYLITGIDNKTGVNFDASYDSVIEEFFALEGIDSTGCHVFVNGVAQLGLTGYAITGNYYTATVVPTGNCLFSGAKIYSNRSFSRQDRMVYDLNPFYTEIDGFYDINFSHDGSINQTFITNNALLDAVYFNGVKLVINKDYVASGSSGITFQTGNSLYDGVTGAVWSQPVDNDYSRSTVSGLEPSFNKFARNASLFWVNGVRQNLNETYLEISTNDFLNGTGLFAPENLLFSNQIAFFFTGVPPEFSGSFMIEDGFNFLLENGDFLLLG